MKKNRFVRFSAILMALVMVLGALTACGKNGENKPNPYAGMTDAELIVGKWEGEISYGGLIDAVSKARDDHFDARYFETMAAYCNEIGINDIQMKVDAEFKDDGTYTGEIDKKSYEDAAKLAEERLIANPKAFVRMQCAMGTDLNYSEITDEMLDAFLDERSMTWEQVSDLLNSIGGFADVDETSFAGKYEIKDGKLYITYGEDADPGEDDATDYTVSAKELTFALNLDGVKLDLTFKRAD